MRVRKIGTWTQTTAREGSDSGFYLEAIDRPADSPRYTAVSYSLLWEDTQTKPLARGKIVEMAADLEELHFRIDQCL
jgi:hypothetical protein